MHKIIHENHNCLYLNHVKLIEQQYAEFTHDKERYKLKPELFNFKPKTAAEDKNVGSQNKRKADAENEECEELKKLIQPFREEIQNLIHQEYVKYLENIPRTWEEKLDFPKFHGANGTTDFQTTKFQEHDFIIPPYCKFYNHNINDVRQILPELEKYDLIIMDMPWQNKYIKRLKKVRDSLAYHMLDNDSLQNIPIQEMIHANSLVVLWCTNAPQHLNAVQNDFLPKWNLQIVHTLKWFKFNTEGNLISPIKAQGYKQPFETVFITCHKNRNLNNLDGIKSIDFIASLPSIIHSHKPPLAMWLREFLDDSVHFKGLEIFARYLQPQFTSIGLEVLKLMDKRLYNKIQS
ncbi:N(6)-adenine-specific methyltransferase METTL4-like [Musca vetustissima]|uniref:N(6)-adenine-specific methyltransferase METTL4-like n=1 Tax=Musca vetustissima TaxID=27455 RepID=UPI002AB70F71|nr:N(6)-adenine-specific methyltransferase METTL4-like [Musca vetustissima]